MCQCHNHCSEDAVWLPKKYLYSKLKIISKWTLIFSWVIGTIIFHSICFYITTHTLFKTINRYILPSLCSQRTVHQPRISCHQYNHMQHDWSFQGTVLGCPWSENVLKKATRKHVEGTGKLGHLLLLKNIMTWQLMDISGAEANSLKNDQVDTWWWQLSMVTMKAVKHGRIGWTQCLYAGIWI